MKNLFPIILVFAIGIGAVYSVPTEDLVVHTIAGYNHTWYSGIFFCEK